MERFQKAKYTRIVGNLRMELDSWYFRYKRAVEEDRLIYTDEQLKTWDDRKHWLEDIVVRLTDLESDLFYGPAE